MFDKLKGSALIIHGGVIRLVLTLDASLVLKLSIELSLQGSILELLLKRKLSISYHSVEGVLVGIGCLRRDDSTLLNLKYEFQRLRLSLKGEATLEKVIANRELHLLNRSGYWQLRLLNLFFRWLLLSSRLLSNRLLLSGSSGLLLGSSGLLLGSSGLLLGSNRLLLGGNRLRLLAGIKLTKIVASLLNKLELLLILSNVLEEALFELVKIACKLGSFLFHDGVILLDWLLEICLSLGQLKVLFAAELSIEDGSHDFLLLRLQGLIVERSAQAHHGDCAICVTDGGHLSLDGNGS